MLNCNSDYGCGTEHQCEHDPPWKMFDFDEYFTRKEYEYLTMGCSVTYGSDIKKKDTWRSQLFDSVDLSVPGIGIDALWHNLKFIMKQTKVRFNKIIILLPSLTRRTHKIYKDGLVFHFLININEKQNRHPNFAFKPKEMDKIIEEQKRHLIENGEEYNKLQLDGLCDWLNQSHEQKTKFFISSWDTEVYSILAEKFKSQKVLLDMFPKDYKPNTAIPHPSADSHRFWFDKIKNKI